MQEDGELRSRNVERLQKLALQVYFSIGSKVSKSELAFIINLLNYPSIQIYKRRLIFKSLFEKESDNS